MTSNYQTYSIPLQTDSAKASDHSQFYKVSPELSRAKSAYEKVMEDVNWAWFYASQFATDNLSNKGEKAYNEYNKSENKIKEYNKNIVETERLLKIYDQYIETKN